MDIEIIKGALNKRHPYLLVDKLVSYEPGENITILKNISYSDWYFNVTYLGERYVPTFVIDEIMNQTAEAGLLLSERYRGKKFLLLGMDNCRYHRRIIPGDALILTAELERLRLTAGTVKVRGFVDGDEVCEASLIYSME